MAVTKIHAITQTIQKAIDYICNPDKTDGELLVDSFGCSPKMAEIQFESILSQGTDRGENKAFHLIQSFAPGEVDAETAHRIGIELADKLLKGNYSYVIATHIDKVSVHNHIIFCAADNVRHRKFVVWNHTYGYIRRLSDRLCLKNRLSVIKNILKNKGKSYESWLADQNDTPLRDKVRRDVKECIRKAHSYDDFIRLMKERDYEIKGEKLPSQPGEKVPKYIAFRPAGYDRFVRGSFKSLGKGFTREEIVSAIEKQREIRAATTTIPVRTMEDLIRRTGPYDHLIDTESGNFSSAPGLKEWARTQNLKTAMHAYALAGDTIQLQEKIDEKEQQFSELEASILETDSRLAKLKELVVYADHYHQNKIYHERYERSGNKERYYQRHESQILLYEAADRFIRSNGLNPSEIHPKKIRDTIARLSERNKVRTGHFQALEKELRELKRQREIIEVYTDKDKNKDKNKDKDAGALEKNRSTRGGGGRSLSLG